MEKDNPVSHGKSLHFKSAICCHERTIFTLPPTAPKPDIQTLATKKYIPKAMSHGNLLQRIRDKQIKILTFLSDGEVYTTMKNTSHLLRLGERQTQHTLSCMVRDKLLKVEVLIDGTRIYGMTALGAEYLNSELPFKVLQLGKTNIKTVPHHLLSQWVRIQMIDYDANDWVAGKLLFGTKFFSNVPDGYFRHKEKKVAVEIELTLKYGDSFKIVLKNYCDDLGAMDDATAKLHLVIYFTPHFDKVQEGIRKFVPAELQSRFFVMRLDTNIKPYNRHELNFLDDDLYDFVRQIRRVRRDE